MTLKRSRMRNFCTRGSLREQYSVSGLFSVALLRCCAVASDKNALERRFGIRHKCETKETLSHSLTFDPQSFPISRSAAPLTEL